MKFVSEDNNAIGCAEITSSSVGVLSEDRLKMLELLAKEPLYPAQLAREMHMSVQTVYYHVKLLEDAGLVKFVEYEEKRGAVAKKFASVSDSLAIVLNKDAWKRNVVKKKNLPELLIPFIKNGFFNGRMVLGSPDPHGKYRARGSELCMVEFSALLGQYAAFSFPLYSLDTELRESEKKQNLILAGGPKVNVLVSEINKNLPIKFEEAAFDIYSTLSKKKYGENVGVVELINSPFARNSKILLLGGLNQHGTRAAVLSLVKKMKQIQEGNMYNSKVIAKVVEGFDDNGDGVVDTVEILE